jgi:hypothetical protein
LEILLNQPSHVQFLDGDADKVAAINKTQKEFDECLEKFKKRCSALSNEKKSNAHCFYESTKRDSLTLTLLIDFFQEPDFFKVKSPVKIIDFFNTAKDRIEKEINLETIHTKDIKTQLYLLDFALSSGMTLSDKFITSFFANKNPISNEILEFFIQHHIRWSVISVDDNETLFYWLGENEHFDIIEKIKKADPDIVNAKNDENRTTLSQAVLNKDADVVRALLEMGANPNIEEFNGDCPLHIALLYNVKIEIIEDLLSHGANVNAGKTPKA